MSDNLGYACWRQFVAYSRPTVDGVGKNSHPKERFCGKGRIFWLFPLWQTFVALRTRPFSLNLKGFSPLMRSGQRLALVPQQGATALLSERDPQGILSFENSKGKLMIVVQRLERVARIWPKMCGSERVATAIFITLKRQQTVFEIRASE